MVVIGQTLEHLRRSYQLYTVKQIVIWSATATAVSIILQAPWKVRPHSSPTLLMRVCWSWDHHILYECEWMCNEAHCTGLRHTSSTSKTTEHTETHKHRATEPAMMEFLFAFVGIFAGVVLLNIKKKVYIKRNSHPFVHDGWILSWYVSSVTFSIISWIYLYGYYLGDHQLIFFLTSHIHCGLTYL